MCFGRIDQALHSVTNLLEIRCPYAYVTIMDVTEHAGWRSARRNETADQTHDALLVWELAGQSSLDRVAGLEREANGRASA